MANKKCIKRLQKELNNLKDDPPPPQIVISPDPDNIQNFYFVFHKLDAPYESGVYLGKIKFPDEYPHKAPTFSIITPSGRFTPNTTLCTTFSHYHPEHWSPMWTANNMLIGLLSFWYDESPTSVGSISSSTEERRRLAHKSMKFNMENNKFRDLFPQFLID